MHRFLAAFLVVLIASGSLVSLQATAQAQDSLNSEPMRLPVDPFPLIFTTGRGDVSFSIEVADRDEERARGLMFRHDLPDDRGMLFIFEQTRRVAFWMKNTPLPLDLVFIGENGVVLNISGGEPQSTDVISPPTPVRFVLELKAGTAQKAGIADGDRVHHPLIDAIVKGG